MDWPLAWFAGREFVESFACGDVMVDRRLEVRRVCFVIQAREKIGQSALDIANEA